MKIRKNSVLRALRGGSYFDDPSYLLGSDRDRAASVLRYRFSGFRFVIRGTK